jgi:ribosomal-protein-serine acetyltransferase
MLAQKITPGLELRLLQPDDVNQLFRVIDENRAQLREWLPWVDETIKVADTGKFIRRSLREYAETQAFKSGIWSSGRLVGVIGHNRIDWPNRIAFPGYWLAPEARGQGIMGRCCRAVFAHAFEQLKVHRIVIGVATGNLRGQALAQRLGFTQISTLKNAEWLNDRSVDHLIYSLSAPVTDRTGGAQGLSEPLVFNAFG